MKLNDFKVVLASGSPRRLEILEGDGIEPLVLRPGCSEDIHLDLSPAQTVMALALRKGLDAEKLLAEGKAPFEVPDGPFVIISSDTIVHKDGKIYGKPESSEDAAAMLKSLRNACHQVYSGVFLNIKGTGVRLLFCDKTDVYVNDFTDDWLDAYVHSGEPFDKAGGYAIQGAFGCNIDHIEGAYDNVVGLPLEKIKRMLEGVTAAPQGSGR
ncbi:MAG: septum formation protein Maf [Firmicutes bacterium]|nr:septum formation protein Maf [Bacillota bacterium]